MCGRYFLSDEEYEIQQILKEIESRHNGTVKVGEVYPANMAPIMKYGQELAAVKWGFPKWNSSGVIINARAETAFEKTMFRISMLERRCVIPSCGFYEWDREKSRKAKYLIRRPVSNLVYMAGAWNRFKSTEGGEYEAFVILTTESNESMKPPETELSLFPDERRPIHDRMPVILDTYEVDDWLEDNDFACDILRRRGPELVLTMV